MPSKRGRKIFALVVKSIILVVFVFLATLAYLNKQYIIDRVVVWQFVPSDGVLDLVDRAGMNDNGKFLYLAGQPKVEEAKDFNGDCQRTETTTSILGCYNNGLIYIYNVTDPKLDGIREVTAAHETLHVAYARLSYDEKAKVDSLLELEYAKLSSDSVFRDKMAFYDRTEAGQRDNELHSLIGTEVALINPELETYYSKYFSDRKKVVNLNTKYLDVFKTIQDKANALKIEMDAMSADIKSKTDKYNSDINILNNDIQAFNNMANNNSFSSQQQFNDQRTALTDRTSSADLDRQRINDEISQYNSVLGQYNMLATQSHDLYKNIDSNLAPTPSI
jgi:cell division septum initiation protein DivIVA